MTIIYAIRNRDDNRHYIGKTDRSLQVRWSEHLSKSRKGTKMYVDRAIQKHGADKFQIYVLAAVEKDKAADVECFYIALFQSNHEEFGYNLTLGGEGVSGFVGHFKGKKFTPIHRQRIAEATKKRSDIGEFSRNGRLVNKGRKHTLESRANMGRSHIGHKHSPETIAKMSAARYAYYERKHQADWVVN